MYIMQTHILAYVSIAISIEDNFASARVIGYWKITARRESERGREGGMKNEIYPLELLANVSALIPLEELALQRPSTRYNGEFVVPHLSKQMTLQMPFLRHPRDKWLNIALVPSIFLPIPSWSSRRAAAPGFRGSPCRSLWRPDKSYDCRARFRYPPRRDRCTPYRCNSRPCNRTAQE